MSDHLQLIAAQAQIVRLEARITELLAMVAARDASLVLSGELARARGAIVDELLLRLESLQASIGR